MEYGPDGLHTSDIGFITQTKKIFEVDDISVPDDSCCLLAVAVRYGLVFCANGNIVKVFHCQALLGQGEPLPLVIIDAGNDITHISTSCDGLTLLVIILHNDKPKGLFYDIRSLLENESPTPFAAKSINGSRVQAVSWNPRDPCNVAIATAPQDLAVITIEDNRLDAKSKSIAASALSWSPKGKQLTVGLADGSLALFKPDLQLVRNVKCPPMNGIGSVQSLTWFSNTEFFIGYKLESEEGGQVMMYVNAPKAQEPRFILYEFICNDNVGPLPPMFYQIFFQEWNILCLASSRAAQLGVLGTCDGGGWCEYELEEGKQAVMHCINITETTYALGMAVDFTSNKVFEHKDGSTSGPCPVIYVLSTGGELNIFHVTNGRPGIDSLVLPMETLPKTGHRTLSQYQGLGSPLPTIAKPAIVPVQPMGLFDSSTPAKQPAQIPKATPASGFSMTPIAPKMPFDPKGSTLGSLMFGGVPSQPSLSSFAPQALPATISGGGTGIFNSSSMGTPAMGSLSNPAIGSLSTPALGSLSSPAIGSLSTPAMESLSNSALGSQSSPVMGSLSGAFVQMGNNSKNDQLKAPQMATLASNFTQPKQPQLQVISTPIKSQTPSPAAPSSPLPRAAEAQSSCKPQNPLGIPQTTSAGKILDDGVVLNIITSALSQFEEELHNHMSHQTSYEVGNKDDMGYIRQSLTEESAWIDQMSSTTSELMGEITQLHSEVLQGFKLREEADAQINKSKNPRHFSSIQCRQLDPHSRKQLEDIRSKYQYLQSQIEEVNARLHLEWISYTNAIKNKKKRDLPITDTVYNALMKCHTLRTRQEKDLESLCDHLKTFEVNTLSRGLRGSRQLKQDDILANLEKSLREVRLSPSSHVSPVKNLSPSKQEKLQKILAQRNMIPVRKCGGSPKVSLEDLSRYTESSPHRNFLQETSRPIPSSPFSFGPQTCSTPNHNSKLLGYLNKSETSFTSHIPKKSGNGNGELAGSVTNGSTSPRRPPAMFSTSTANQESSVGVVPSAAIRAIYEDVTPPQTPAVKGNGASKSPSPLVALSSLVNNVPAKTTSSEAMPSLTITESKPTFIETQGTMFDIVGSSSSPMKFSFKPQGSTTLGAILATKTPGEESVLGNKSDTKVLPQFTSANLSDSQVLSPASVTGNQITITPLPMTSTPSKEGSISSTGGGLFYPKPSATTSGLFSLGLTASSTSLSSGTDGSNKSSFTVFSSSNSASIFGSALSSTISVTSANSTVATSPTFSAQSVKQIGTESSLFSSVSVAPFKGSKDSKDSGTFVLTKPALGSGVTLTPKGPENEGLATLGNKATPLPSAGTGLASTGLFTLSKSPSGSDKSPVSSAGNTNSIFGKPSTSTNTLFQNSAGSTTGGLFGGSVTLSFVKSTEANATTGIFGGGTTSMAKSSKTGGIFGSGLSGTVLGSLQTSSGSPLGSTPTTSMKCTEDNAVTSKSTVDDTKSTTASSSGGLFGGISSLSSSGGSLFGGTTTTPAGGSVFGSTSSPTTSSGGSIFGTSTTVSGGSIFGSAPSTSSSSTPSIFGSSAATTTASGIFGSTSTVSAQSAGSIFGVTLTQTTVSTGSVFGGAAVPSTASSGSLFGGTLSSSTAPSGSVFGSAAVPSTTLGGSMFGGTTSASTAANGSVFGSATVPAATPSTTSSTNVLGEISTDGATMDMVGFGSLATSTSGSAFGQQSAFGTLPTSTAGTGFGSTSLNFSTSATSNAGGSVFGQKSGSVFGQKTQSSTPLFAIQPSTSSIFGGSPNQGSTTGSVLGGSQGQGGSVFGATAPKSTSLFGGTAVSSAGTSPFGSTTTSTSNNSGITFGQSSPGAASPFASASTSQGTGSLFSSTSFGSGTGGGGGGFFSGLGSKPSEENANKNIFGSTSFAGAKPQLNLFGGSTQSSTSSFGGGQTSTSSFVGGQTSTSSTFGSPAFVAQDNGSGSSSSSGATVLQSGFGMTTPTKASGFGGAPAFGGSAVFGGSPAFGSPPKFGSSPSFGGTATFGSIGSGTGGAGAAGGCGGGGTTGGFRSFASTGGATFGSVASSGTSGGGVVAFGGFGSQSTGGSSFGGLAPQSTGQQQQQQQQSSPFGGNSANAFGGGSSFSTWR